MLTPEERRLKELIDGLRKDLHALTDALNKHTETFERSESSRNASDQQAEDARIRAIILSEVNRNRDHPETQQRKKEWSSFEKWYFTLQLFLFVATAAAFGAAYWYASVADIQKNDVIYKQTPKIIENANAATRTANTSETAFRLDERPWLGISDIAMIRPESGMNMEVDITFTNSGKTPALKVRGGNNYKINPVYVFGPQAGWSTTYRDDPLNAVAPQAHMIRKIDLRSDRFDLEAIAEAKQFVYFYGEITYEDISHTFSGWTQFCVVVGKANIAPRVVGVSFCPDFNNMR